jgi:SAM-dependent methyltransferase
MKTRKTDKDNNMHPSRKTSLVALILALTIPSTEFAVGQAKRSFDDEIFELLEVRPSMVVAEIGAGNGDFALRLGTAVGSEGRVYANEIEPEFGKLAKKIEGKKAGGNASNLTVILGGETDPLLPEKEDLICLLWVYHHLSKPDEFMANLPKYLKAGGRLAVVAIDIDRVQNRPKKTGSSPDPCQSKPAETQAAIEKTGFALKKMEYLTDYPELYLLIFETRRIS